MCTLLLISFLLLPVTLTSVQRDSSILEPEDAQSESLFALPESSPVVPPDEEEPNDWNTSLLVTNINHQEGAFDGYNLFTLQIRDSGYRFKGWWILVLDMEGNIIIDKIWEGDPIRFLNSTTVYGHYLDQTMIWNMFTDTVQLLDFHGHHDIEYNYANNTFLTIVDYFVEIEGLSCRYDRIVEYDFDGTEVWSVDTQPFITLDQVCPDCPSTLHVDAVHGNTVFYDIDEDVIYFNARNTNTFYKIDHKTGELLWALGQYGDFALYNIHGNPRDILWYHSHSLEKVDDNTFILFDNDLHNQTNPINDRSRLVEITINETTMTANESWVWSAPAEYHSRIWGDADRLPNGNRLGTFGFINHPEPGDTLGGRLVEVTDAGEIVWELNLPYTDYILGVYRTERFRFEPILSSPEDIFSTTGDVTAEWDAWYNFRPKHTINGTYTLYLDDAEVDSGIVSYDKFWRPTNLTFNLDGLEDGLYNLTLAVTDGEGHTATDSLNMTIGPFYIVREGPTAIEKGQEGAMIRWDGYTSSPLFYNITLDTTLHTAGTWDSETIPLDLAVLDEGSTDVTLRLYNGTDLVHTDSFSVDVYAPVIPVIIPSQPNQVTITWNDTPTLSWTLTDDFPSSWSVFLEDSLVALGSWTSQTYLLNWTVPLLDEGEYNITVVAYDLAGQRATNTTWLTIESPSPPAIIFLSGQTQFLWGQENALLSFEIHGGLQWALWRNEVQIRGAGLTGHQLDILIENWQVEEWSLGIHNVTLEVTDSFNARTSLTLWIQILISLGDPYVDACLHTYSEWYLFGDSAVGAPDETYTQVFLDYGNGYVTLDMGAGEEVLDGPDADFWVIAQGGEYNVRAGNSLTVALTTIGHGQGTQSFNLTGTGLTKARYIRIEYRDGDTVRLDAIVAIHYNQIGGDTDSPTVNSPADFWVLETQTPISFTWEANDTNPWNYSITIDGSIYESGPWNGSDILFNYDIPSTGTWVKHNITLTLFDVCGLHNHDVVLVDILPVDAESPQITGPENFWILETQTTLSWVWECTDLTPSNYTILVDGVLYETGLWDGSAITFSYNVSRTGILTVTLTLCDFFGHQTSDTVLVDVRSLLSGPADPVIQLALTVFILGTIIALPALLFWTLRGRRPL